jgi:hypothetical protein
VLFRTGGTVAAAASSIQTQHVNQWHLSDEESKLEWTSERTCNGLSRPGCPNSARHTRTLRSGRTCRGRRRCCCRSVLRTSSRSSGHCRRKSRRGKGTSRGRCTCCSCCSTCCSSIRSSLCRTHTGCSSGAYASRRLTSMCCRSMARGRCRSRRNCTG